MSGQGTRHAGQRDERVGSVETSRTNVAASPHTVSFVLRFHLKWTLNSRMVGPLMQLEPGQNSAAVRVLQPLTVVPRRQVGTASAVETFDESSFLRKDVYMTIEK